MALITKTPITPGQRFRVAPRNVFTSKEPEKRLLESKKNSGGRNCYGRITSRRRGGGHKRRYRIIDFKRTKYDIPAKVQFIEYDPNRSAHIALVAYADGEKCYILAPNKLNVADTIITVDKKKAEFDVGNNMRLRDLPPSTKIHAIEMQPGSGAKLVRSAGTAAQLISVERNLATLKMPSGEIRMLHADCRATIGEVGNSEYQNIALGKAGRNRWKNKRPRVRGVAMNPVDHPMGGGEGRTSGGGHPTSPWGKLAKGFPTRIKSKPSNSMILVRRNGRKMKG